VGVVGEAVMSSYLFGWLWLRWGGGSTTGDYSRYIPTLTKKATRTPSLVAVSDYRCHSPMTLLHCNEQDSYRTSRQEEFGVDDTQ
jgi:hypothetical protein